eukprot:42998-Eustigmatos_ZCMA.PRE.1
MTLMMTTLVRAMTMRLMRIMMRGMVMKAHRSVRSSARRPVRSEVGCSHCCRLVTYRSPQEAHSVFLGVESGGLLSDEEESSEDEDDARWASASAPVFRCV